MYPVKDVSDVLMAFPASVKELMPTWEEIPAEFKNGSAKECQLFSDWFFCGLTKLKIKPKKDVNEEKALRHIKCIMGSYEPKHEHKEAAVAFLFREWFDVKSWKAKKR